jgi:hypothetical protein
MSVRLAYAGFTRVLLISNRINKSRHTKIVRVSNDFYLPNFPYTIYHQQFVNPVADSLNNNSATNWKTLLKRIILKELKTFRSRKNE